MCNNVQQQMQQCVQRRIFQNTSTCCQGGSLCSGLSDCRIAFCHQPSTGCIWSLHETARHRANSTLCSLCTLWTLWGLLHFVRCIVQWFTGRICTSPVRPSLVWSHFFRWFFQTCVRKGGARDILLTVKDTTIARPLNTRIWRERKNHSKTLIYLSLELISN